MAPVRNKILLGAWLDVRVVEAVRKWLSLRPEMDETAFLIAAIAEELRSSKVAFPKDAISSRSLARAVSRPAAGESCTPKLPESSARMSVPVTKKGKIEAAGPRRGNKQLLKARVDERLLAAMETSLQDTACSRTDFILSAVARKLSRDGIKVPDDAVQRKARRRPLRREAYLEIDEREAVLRQIVDCTLKMKTLLRRMARFGKGKAFARTEAYTAKLAKLSGKDREMFLRSRRGVPPQIRDQLRQVLNQWSDLYSETERLLQESGVLEDKARRSGLKS